MERGNSSAVGGVGFETEADGVGAVGNVGLGTDTGGAGTGIGAGAGFTGGETTGNGNVLATIRCRLIILWGCR